MRSKPISVRDLALTCAQEPELKYYRALLRAIAKEQPGDTVLPPTADFLIATLILMFAEVRTESQWSGKEIVLVGELVEAINQIIRIKDHYHRSDE